MKFIFINLIFILLQFTVKAQEMQDSCDVVKITNSQIPIDLTDYTNLRSAYTEAVELNSRLKFENTILKEKDSISVVYRIKEAKLREHIKKVDTVLINIVSNFLYIPFEAYSIQKIAIPAFKIISDSSLIHKHQIKFGLLVRYQVHVNNMRDYLTLMQTDLMKPFSKRDLAMQWLNTFKEQAFYRDYCRYDDFKSTYLGKLFNEVESRLNHFDGETNKVNFIDIITELDKCLKTIEDL